MVNVRDIKEELSMVKIQDFNNYILDMLMVMEMLYEKILWEGGLHDDCEDDLLKALAIVENENFSLKVILMRGIRDKGEKVRAVEIISIAI